MDELQRRRQNGGVWPDEGARRRDETNLPGHASPSPLLFKSWSFAKDTTICPDT
jgi:hypothetical protein